MEDKVIQQSFTFKNSDRMTAQAKKTATNIQKRKWQVKEMKEDYAGQRFILRLGIVAVPVISIGAAYILIKRKYIIDERKYEELVEEIKSTNKK